MGTFRLHLLSPDANEILGFIYFPRFMGKFPLHLLYPDANGSLLTSSGVPRGLTLPHCGIPHHCCLAYLETFLTAATSACWCYVMGTAALMCIDTMEAAEVSRHLKGPDGHVRMIILTS